MEDETREARKEGIKQEKPPLRGGWIKNRDNYLNLINMLYVHERLFEVVQIYNYWTINVLGDIPVCCLKYLPNDDCVEKLRWYAIS